LIEQDEESGLVSAMGGKWTIFRKMGEETIDLVLDILKKNGNIDE
jgi:glycerol-3-phosphate dehydrogenase